MNFNKMCEDVEIHYRAIQGKKKFIDYFLNGDLQRNIIPSTQNMECKFYDTPIGDVTEYITLRTPSFGTNHIQNAIETGDIPLNVSLGYHLIHVNEDADAGEKYWYYNATKTLEARKLPPRIYNYLLRKLQYSDPGRHIMNTHIRGYSVLVDSYDEVLEIFRNDYQYQSELVFYNHSNGKSVHPSGEWYRFCPDPDATLQYDDFYPELTEDKFFNIQLQGMAESDVLFQLRKIQYSASTEVRSRISYHFWHKCKDVL